MKRIISSFMAIVLSIAIISPQALTLTANAYSCDIYGHTEGKGVVTSNPTCTKAGVLVYTCSECGTPMRTADMAALGHSFESGKCTLCGIESGTPSTTPAENFIYRVSSGQAIITSWISCASPVVIPATLGGYRVTAIDDYAFSGSMIQEVVIPQGVKTIGASAFENCDHLTKVTFPTSLAVVGVNAFKGCPSLRDVYISDLSAWCSIDFQCDNSVWFQPETNPLYTAENLYINGELSTELTVSKNISSYAFYGFDGLKSLVISYGINHIQSMAFSECKNLTSIYVEKNSFFELMGSSAFSDCVNLTDVQLGNRLLLIGDYAFSNCTSLTRIDLPDSVLEIGSSAFSDCSNLTTITIPAKVTTISQSAFNNCSKLSKAIYKGRISSLTIEDWNTELINSLVCATHLYYTAYDTTCIECGATRTISVVPHECAHMFIDDVTQATLSKNGKIISECFLCGKKTPATTIYAAKTVKLSATSYTYNGKVKKPSVIVKDSAGKKISSKYYTVSYASGRKNVGTYKVTVTFKGNYTGTKTLSFKILPKKVSSLKVKAGKKKMTVSWKKDSKAGGYEIKYATSKKFKKAKTVKIKSYKTAKKVISKLKSKKTYYVKVRAFKKVGGKTYYGSYSSVKKVKVK